MIMKKVYLLSRRDPKGPWMIRNRFGVFTEVDTDGIKRAKEAAHIALVGWSRCGIEGNTEFMVSVE